jgi:hypothetical protein
MRLYRFGFLAAARQRAQLTVMLGLRIAPIAQLFSGIFPFASLQV